MSNHLTLSEAVQRAVVATLSGDTVLTGMLTGVFDAVPLNTPLPYITFATASVSDLSNTGVQVTEVRFTLHIWSEYAGRGEVLAIMRRMETLLTKQSLTLITGSLIALTLRQSDTRMDFDATKRLGRMEYRALVQAS
jgi:hypothetical protein